MSSQKGNTSRQRPQKHTNIRRFVNNLNDKSPRVLTMNNIDLSEWELCKRCVEIIQWKINYKKYKALTQPKKCVKCSEKTVKRAYCVACSKCANDMGICGKCLKNLDDLDDKPKSSSKMKARMLNKDEDEQNIIIKKDVDSDDDDKYNSEENDSDEHEDDDDR